MAEAAKRTRLVSIDPVEGILKVWSLPDDEGDQTIETTFSPAVANWPAEMVRQMAVIGFNATASNQYNRLDQKTPANVLKAITDLHTSVADGSWTPGRTFVGEPDDIVLAIAEATGRPVHVVQKDIDERVKVDATTGEPVRDKKNRTMRVFSKSVLRNLENDPAIAPILARLAAERAKVSKKEGASTGILDMFKDQRAGNAATTDQEAAN